MDFQIICPSYKRAGKTKTDKFIGDSLFFAVHSFDEPEYRKSNPRNGIVILSEESRGNMAAVRNEIIEKSTSDYLIMMDDDCAFFGYHEDGLVNKLNNTELYGLIETGFSMADSLGTPLWGLNVHADQQAYKEYSPLSMISPVLGPFTAINKRMLGSVRYDERLGLNEDYDLFIQVVRRFGKSLRFNKYFYSADHLLLDNGCASYRTLDREYKQAITMIKKWGNKVVTYDFSKSTNPRIRIPKGGI